MEFRIFVFSLCLTQIYLISTINKKKKKKKKIAELLENTFLPKRSHAAKITSSTKAHLSGNFHKVSITQSKLSINLDSKNIAVQPEFGLGHNTYSYIFKQLFRCILVHH